MYLTVFLEQMKRYQKKKRSEQMLNVENLGVGQIATYVHNLWIVRRYLAFRHFLHLLCQIPRQDPSLPFKASIKH